MKLKVLPNRTNGVCSNLPHTTVTLISTIATAIFFFPVVVRSESSGWKVYNTDNSGIPDDRVTRIGIDLQGNIWAAHSSGTGIGSGCAMFDGKNWTVYNTSNSGLPHDMSMGALKPASNVRVKTSH